MVSFGFCCGLSQDILLGCRNDFGKYASRAKHKYLQKLFEKAPGMVSKQFKYVDVDPHMVSRDLKAAVEMLSNAGFINCIYNTSANGVPLKNQVNEKKF